MDSLTQATLGAAIGAAVLGNKIGKKGALLGGIVATIPDLDIVFLPFLDPLERLSMHRGFSHSILFSVLGAALIAYLLSKVKWTKTLPFLRLFLFAWLALITHMLLDAFTPYGTLLFLPFSNARFGWDSINIIDPFYTLPLLLGLLIGLKSKGKIFLTRNANAIGLLVSSAYLILTLFIKNDVEQKFHNRFKEEKLTITKTLSEPVGIGSMKWYGIGRTKDGFYIGSYSYLKNEPIGLDYFTTGDSLLIDLDPYTIQQMVWFSKDFYHVASHGDSLFFYNMQVDMQGVHQMGTVKVPTKGYFILENKKNGKLIGSGRHQISK